MLCKSPVNLTELAYIPLYTTMLASCLIGQSVTLLDETMETIAIFSTEQTKST